jgi:Zn-finger nucleic acid-binding protein
MDCPRDRTPLAEQRYEASIDVDACATCGGIWLDAGELNAIQESKERDYSADLARMPDVLRDAGLAEDVARQRSEPSGPCPRCNTMMVTDEYAYCSQIVVDVCPAGCGLWLDKGELRAIEIFFERTRRDAANDPQNIEDDALWRLRSFWGSLRAGFRRKTAKT